MMKKNMEVDVESAELMVRCGTKLRSCVFQYSWKCATMTADDINVRYCLLVG